MNKNRFQFKLKSVFGFYKRVYQIEDKEKTTQKLQIENEEVEIGM